MQQYDRIHDWFVAERSPEVGVADVRAALAPLPRGSRVLELGCGTGLPLGRLILGLGCTLHGLDSSPAMLASFRRNCPAATSELGPMEAADLGEAIYDAAICWGVLFHLDASAQRAAIRNAARALKPGGLFLFTCAQEADTREGTMDGVAFHYLSLGKEAYDETLREAGMVLEKDYEDPHENYVYLARKAQG